MLYHMSFFFFFFWGGGGGKGGGDDGGGDDGGRGMVWGRKESRTVWAPFSFCMRPLKLLRFSFWFPWQDTKKGLKNDTLSLTAFANLINGTMVLGKMGVCSSPSGLVRTEESRNSVGSVSQNCGLVRFIEVPLDLFLIAPFSTLEEQSVCSLFIQRVFAFDRIGP